MTRGFLSVSIMKPNHNWTVLHMSILAGLLLTLSAQSEDSDCVPEIKVHRHTVYKVSLGENLQIKCPVTFCNSSHLSISWYKFEKTYVPINFINNSHIKTKTQFEAHREGISYLIFENIERGDSGQYQCQSVGSVSHGINVSVDENGKHPNDTKKNGTVSINPGNQVPDNMWMFVYCAAGILGFVVIVIIISVISMRGCKETPKKETQTENQYMAIPMDERPVSHENHQRPPRGSPSGPPSRRSTRKRTQPSEPHELPREHVYGMIKDDQVTLGNIAEDEGSSVVYAALNHQLPRAAPARPLWQMEESSEYAAIRVS